MNNKELLVAILLFGFLASSENQLLAQQSDAKTSKDRRLRTSEKLDGTKFIRMAKDSLGAPDSLQTSITRYQSDDKKLLVDLIGVIHVGEEIYYKKLNRQFQQYDSLLYELVAPPQSRVPQPGNSETGSNPVRWIQNSMQRMLGLESQLTHIDYTKSNFVHADLSPRQMQQKMAERGETAWSLGLQAFSEMMKDAQSKSQGALGSVDDIQSFEDLFGLINNPRKLKVMMATQFASSESLEAGLGKTLNQLLITDRNKAAMKVLDQEIDKGQKKIGIFYGAAHMPDFEKRLVDELGLKKTKQAWVKAWDLKSPSGNTRTTDSLLQTLLELIDQ